MKIMIDNGAVERFEHSHADLLQEIRLMAEADRDGRASVAAAPQAAARPSLFARLFSRAAPTRRAA